MPELIENMCQRALEASIVRTRNNLSTVYDILFK